MTDLISREAAIATCKALLGTMPTCSLGTAQIKVAETLRALPAQAPAVGVADVDAVIDIVLQEVHGPLWRAILSSEDCLNRVCTDKTPESCICAPKIDRIESHARSQAKARILAAIEPAQGGEA